MSKSDKVFGALSKLGKMSEPRSRPIPAIMGNGAGVIDVPNEQYLIWVRLHGDQNQLARAYCFNHARINDLQITVDHSTSRTGGVTTYEVVGYGSKEILSDHGAIIPPIGPGDPYLPDHAASHQWSAFSRGRDVVNIFPRAIAHGRVYADDPPSMQCRVSAIEYYYGNVRKYYAGGKTIDFTSEIPSTGLAKLAFVYMNGGTNTLAYEYSAEFLWLGWTDPIPSVANPTVPIESFLLSSPILYNGMTTIVEANFRAEMRPIFHTVGVADHAEVIYDNYGDSMVDNDGNVMYIDHSDDS